MYTADVRVGKGTERVHYEGSLTKDSLCIAMGLFKVKCMYLE